MAMPHVKLFQTPNGFYVLDVNQNEFLPVQDESYAYLRACLASGEEAVTVPEPSEITLLRGKGYLANDTVVKEVRHAYLPYLEVFLERKLNMITLQLTQNCNLRCSYCIYSEGKNRRQRAHSLKSMSWETAQKSIDYLWEHSVDSPKVSIGFYGGEPLLELPLMKKVVAYARKRFEGKAIRFTVTTNGTLMTPEIIAFLAQEDISLLISLDGPKDIQDKNRVFADGRGSFDVILKNIALLTQLAPEYAEKLHISTVIDPDNDFDCINEIMLPGRELEKFTVLSSLVDKDYDNEAVSVSEAYSSKSHYQQFLALLTVFGRFPDDRLSSLSKGIIAYVLQDATFMDTYSPLHAVDAPAGPCVPGQMRMFVNVDGNLFPCERVSECSKAVCLGSLEKGINMQVARSILNIGALTSEACRRCWCIRHCTVCAKKADDGTAALSAKRKLESCERTKLEAYEKCRRYLFLQEVGHFYAQQVRKGGRPDGE